MNKLLISSLMLLLIYNSNAQVFESDRISTWNKASKAITVLDNDGNNLLSLKHNFKNNRQLKKKIKSFKILDKNYIITKEKKGMQHVYAEDWKLIARMTRKGNAIELVESGQLFLKSKCGFSKLCYTDPNQNEIVKSERTNESKYRYTWLGEGESDPLLMSLVLHQLDEQIPDDAYYLTYMAPLMLID